MQLTYQCNSVCQWPAEKALRTQDVNYRSLPSITKRLSPNFSFRRGQQQKSCRKWNLFCRSYFSRRKIFVSREENCCLGRVKQKTVKTKKGGQISPTTFKESRKKNLIFFSLSFFFPRLGEKWNEFLFKRKNFSNFLLQVGQTKCEKETMNIKEGRQTDRPTVDFFFRPFQASCCFLFFFPSKNSNVGNFFPSLSKIISRSWRKKIFYDDKSY